VVVNLIAGIAIFLVALSYYGADELLQRGGDEIAPVERVE
jgi:hypothetical protein